MNIYQNRQEQETLTRPIAIKENDSIIETSQQGKAQDQRFIVSLLSSTKHLNN